MTRESDIMRSIQLAATRAGARLFRNNVGVFLTQNGIPVRTGLCVGSSDLIGWTPLLIQPEHVGQTLAVFTGVEVKTEQGRPSPAQENFIEQVQRAGGFAGLARSNDEMLAIIRRHPEK